MHTPKHVHLLNTSSSIFNSPADRNEERTSSRIPVCGLEFAVDAIVVVVAVSPRDCYIVYKLIDSNWVVWLFVLLWSVHGATERPTRKGWVEEKMRARSNDFTAHHINNSDASHLETLRINPYILLLVQYQRYKNI